MKKLNITKKTHAYILPEYDNVVVRAISENNVAAYEKEGKQVYTTNATATIDGKKQEVKNFYVATTDFVKRTVTRTTQKEAIASKLVGKDLSGMSIEQIKALLA